MKLIEIWDKIAGELINELKKKKHIFLAKKILKIEVQKKYEYLGQYLKQSKIDFLIAKEKWEEMQKEKNKSKESCDLDLAKIDDELKEEKEKKDARGQISHTSQKESKRKIIAYERKKTLPYQRQRSIKKKEAKREVKKKSAREIWANFSKPMYSPFPKEEKMKEMILDLASKI